MSWNHSKTKNGLCDEIVQKTDFIIDVIILIKQNTPYSLLFFMKPQIFNKDLLTTENSLFQPFTTDIESEIQNGKLILDSQFSNSQQLIGLQLYPQLLKLTFLSSNDQPSSSSLFLRLGYTIKAAQLIQKVDDSIIQKSGFSIYIDNGRPYNFFSIDKDLIVLWMTELSKFVTLVGFSSKFRALKYIGRGEFGQVWEVQRQADGTKFAAKIIDKDVCFGQVNGRQALYNEIQILKKLNHPCIVHLECIYESQKSLYIIQQLIEGQLLSEFIRKERNFSITSSPGKLEKERNTKIMKNLLKALAYLHQNGIAHRDLKPGNIIINPHDWMPCIFDFGLSQFTQKQKYLFQCCGSPGYMAPQIFSNSKVQDLKKCDVFSLGSIFYMLLSQQPLFNGNSTEQIIEQTKNCTKTVPKKVKSYFSGAEADLLLQMLEQDPEKRISSDDALFHNFFMDAVCVSMQQIRKSIPDEQISSKYSLDTNNKNTKLQELLSESLIFIQNNFDFTHYLNEEQQDLKSSRNMVTPSSHFTSNTKRRVNRYMSAQNIEVDFLKDNKVEASAWSGKWNKIKSFEEIFRVKFWAVKDLIFQNQ